MNLPIAARSLELGAIAALVLGASLAVPPAKAGLVVLHPTQLTSPDVKGGCVAHGGVRLDPCRIKLNASNLGPDLVTVRTPNGGGILIVKGDCANRGVATITPQGNNQYLVSAGANTGFCYAHFRYYNQQGKKIGGAILHVGNHL